LSNHGLFEKNLGKSNTVNYGAIMSYNVSR